MCMRHTARNRHKARCREQQIQLANSQFFPVKLKIFPVAISEMCDNFLCKTDFQFENFTANIVISCILASGNLQCETKKKRKKRVCFGKIYKFPVFSLTGHFFFGHFPRFACVCSRDPEQSRVGMVDVAERNCCRGSGPRGGQFAMTEMTK